MNYPRRLIEVDLPIKEISAHARREKSIRHGHISTLHIWWARRPLAACRAVICATLWPDPADDLCPQAFRDAAAAALVDFAGEVLLDESLAALCKKGFRRWVRTNQASLRGADPACWADLRYALLDFIADFANWDAATVPSFLNTARRLTQASHEALGGARGTRPLLVDPFAGGGSIPLEALRVGADAFASDLNPVAVLLNKVVLEYIPKYGQRLADEVRKWGQWIKEQAEQELAEFYPKDPDGATPIAYLWARTIRCEGPGCGAEVPLIRSQWLAKKSERSVALRMIANKQAKRVDFEIIEKAKPKDVGEGTVRKGAATCPVCGFTTPVTSVRRQLKTRQGGTADARLFCVVTTEAGQQGRRYRLPSTSDFDGAQKASDELKRRQVTPGESLSLVPDEEISLNELRRISVPLYGMRTWGDIFSPRQSLVLATLSRLVAGAPWVSSPDMPTDLSVALQTVLALVVDRQSDALSSLVTWTPGGEFQGHTFTRQALPIVWDFAEVNPWCDSSGNFAGAVAWVAKVCEAGLSLGGHAGNAERMSATDLSLPDDVAVALVTDPPYYDAVPYAYLSDYFYVWLHRILAPLHPGLFCTLTVPKDAEIVVDRPHELSTSTKDVAFYERELTRAFSDSRRVLDANGVGAIVFASKTTASWEAILQAVVDAGWVITGSWPIDTEREARVSAQGQARLGSSVHLVCRPRPDAENAQSLPRGATTDNVGEWRDVLAELPRRIHEWMPRLAQEGVVGADAIFACLGPALEIFSRYARVEKASGDQVTLREYLEYVWAAVSKEALAMIFEGADATGFEEDARLTAMWLWTLGASPTNGTVVGQSVIEQSVDLSLQTFSVEAEPVDVLVQRMGRVGRNVTIELKEDIEDDDGSDTGDREPQGRSQMYALEYDAARKIGQGLGAHLERLTSLVEVKGDKARLLPVAERARHLFGKDEGQAPARRQSRPVQLSLWAAVDEAEQDGGWGEKSVPDQGKTVLDRAHQSMILFAAGRADALKRFLVDEKVGADERFWRLAQALSALYPAGSDEKRWVDGVLARKKGLGF